MTTYVDKRNYIQRALDAAEAAEAAATPGPWRWYDYKGYGLMARDVGGQPEYRSDLDEVFDDGTAWGEYGSAITGDSPDVAFIAMQRNMARASLAAHRASLPSVEAAAELDARVGMLWTSAHSRTAMEIAALMPVAQAILGVECG